MPSEAERLASYVIWVLIVRAEGSFTREVVLMSKLWMNKIWSWDNCINSLAIASHNTTMAIDQLQIFYDLQAPDGRILDCIGWSSVQWGYTKPPIQRWALLKLMEQDPSIDDHVLLGLYHSTAMFTDFWMQHRRTDVSALPWYSHGNDCGWDNSTAFDAQPVIVGPDCAA
jgi:hypothetical protein